MIKLISQYFADIDQGTVTPENTETFIAGLIDYISNKPKDIRQKVYDTALWYLIRKFSDMEAQKQRLNEPQKDEQVKLHRRMALIHSVTDAVVFSLRSYGIDISQSFLNELEKQHGMANDSYKTIGLRIVPDCYKVLRLNPTEGERQGGQASTEEQHPEHKRGRPEKTIQHYMADGCTLASLNDRFNDKQGAKFAQAVGMARKDGLLTKIPPYSVLNRQWKQTTSRQNYDAAIDAFCVAHDMER